MVFGAVERDVTVPGDVSDVADITEEISDVCKGCAVGTADISSGEQEPSEQATITAVSEQAAITAASIADILFFIVTFSVYYLEYSAGFILSLYLFAASIIASLKESPSSRMALTPLLTLALYSISNDAQAK